MMLTHRSLLPVVALLLGAGVLLWQRPATTSQARSHESLASPVASNQDSDLAAPSASVPSGIAIPQIAASDLESLTTSSEAHANMVATLQTRRRVLKDLIRTNPEAALQAALPWETRRQLPPEFHQYLERPINARGDYGVMVASDFESNRSEVRREVTVAGQRYEAFVYGRMLGRGSAEGIALNGIAVDDVVALSDDPVRVVSKSEAASLAAAGVRVDPVCTVSKEPANVVNEATLVQSGGDFHYVCRASHLYTLNQWLAGDSGGSSGNGGFPVAMDSWSQGPKTMLFMRVNFPDDLTDPISESAAYDLMNNVNNWLVLNSYDTTSLISTVTPLLTLPNTKAYYQVIGDGQLLTDARQVAKEAGYDTADFDLDTVRFTSVPGFSYGGKAYVRGKGCWLQSSSVGVACHEYGHNYGLWHANYWQASGSGIIGPGTHKEYGDIFDTMGSAGAGDKHFSAVHRNKIDWLGDSFVLEANGSGTYRIHAYDIPALTPGRHYAVKVTRDYDREYWLELRQLFAGNAFIQNGVLLRWDPWTQSSGGAHLLDTTPGSPSGNSSKDDAALVLGRTFADPAAGIFITPVAMQGSGADKSVDVVVNLGTFDQNQNPTVAIQASTTTAASGQNIVFTAVANDPDGDPLAYEWDFGGLSFGPNLPAVTNSWTGNVEQVVRCRVSDLKGGFGSALVVVRVGNPSTFQISGRLTDSQGNPIEGARVSNGSTSSSSYRGCFTDSDGNYVITGLSSGNVTVSAALYGHAFSPMGGWSNPVNVTGNRAGIDFSDAPLPVVGMTLVDGDAGEAENNPGTFRITRTGSTASSLNVQYRRSGLASFSADYTLSPNPTGSAPYTVVIPAGSDHVDVVATPNQDTQIEGMETVVLTLEENAGYAVGAMAECTLIIEDDEALSIPSLTVSSSPSSADNRATESGSDTGIFTISRYGNRDAAVLVHFTLEGTATPGVDYVPPGDTVLLPAGASSVNVSFLPIDDSKVEGDETVVLRLTPDPAYNAGSGTATVIIQDDDPPLVKVFSTDNRAIEGGSSTAKFVVQRVGSLAAPLTVNYTLSGTATAGSDYAPLSEAITIAAGSADATITVSALNDSELEGDESVVLILASRPDYNVGLAGSAVIIIQDNEIPTVTLTKPDGTATEGGNDPGQFQFSRGSFSNGDLEVLCTLSGNAVAGSDFAPFPTSIIIPDGATSATLDILPVDDAIKEADEKVTLQLVVSPNYNLGTDGPVSITIKDNNGSGSIAVGFESPASSRLESSTAVKLPVVLSAAGGGVSVKYAVSGGSAQSGADFNLAAGTLTFASGATLATIDFNLVNDSLAEGNETIVITLSNPSGAVLDATTSHTLTIVDDDAGVVSVSAVDNAASEAGDNGTFRISRTGGTSSAMTVNVQLAGTASSPSDYLPIPTTLVIPAGSSFLDVDVVAVNDGTPEQDETVTLRLTSVVGGRLGSPSVATVTIANSDIEILQPLITLQLEDDTTTEGVDDPARFKVLRSDNLDGELTVTLAFSGTVSGTDHSLGTTVVFADGQAEADITVQAIADGQEEPMEELIVTVLESAAYSVNEQNEVRLRFLDSLFMDWQHNTFSGVQLENPAVSGPDADPDLDGLVNFVEFAFNRDPLSADTEPPVVYGMSNIPNSGEQVLTLTFPRRKIQNGFVYQLIASEDLAIWDRTGLNFEEISVLDDDNGITETVTVRALYPTLHFDKVFAVLQIVRD